MFRLKEKLTMYAILICVCTIMWLNHVGQEKLITIIEEQTTQITEQQEQIASLQGDINAMQKDIIKLQEVKKEEVKEPIIKQETSLGTFIAYAYTANDAGCNTKTATGSTATIGKTVAVDPSIIPLGSIVYITSDYPGISGEYLAEDVGGGIRGHMIDIYFGEGKDAYRNAINFGKRNVTIKLMYKVKEEGNLKFKN